MGKQEEASKVYQELLSGDLSDDEFFQVGVGLFRGNQYAPAADAFRKALAKNPSSRDTHYNLAQAIYSQVQDLEDARAKASAADAKTIDAQLKPLYEELQTITQKARTFDPNNRTVLALLARGYRGMADVDVKAATDWKNRTLEVMKTHQDLPFEVADVALSVSETGEAKITGKVVNLKAAEGQAIKLTFSFLGKDGKVLGTQDVTVTAPKAEEQVEFSTSLKAAEPVGGWKYETI
jgi:tetratricopeptide (TPR) repeat protein